MFNDFCLFTVQKADLLATTHLLSERSLSNRDFSWKVHALGLYILKNLHGYRKEYYNYAFNYFETSCLGLGRDSREKSFWTFWDLDFKKFSCLLWII